MPDEDEVLKKLNKDISELLDRVRRLRQENAELRYELNIAQAQVAVYETEEKQ